MVAKVSEFPAPSHQAITYLKVQKAQCVAVTLLQIPNSIRAKVVPSSLTSCVPEAKQAPQTNRNQLAEFCVQELYCWVFNVPAGYQQSQASRV